MALHALTTSVLLERLPGEEVEAGILGKNWRQILRAQKDRRVVVDRPGKLIPQAVLHAGDREETVAGGIIREELINRAILSMDGTLDRKYRLFGMSLDG